MFLEECKYVVKETKFHNSTIDDVQNSSDSDEDLFEKKSDYEENSDV